MKRRLPFLLIAAAPLPAFAQPVESSLTPSRSIACLTPDAAQRSKLEYPADALLRKDGGTVAVELRFLGPGQPPRVKVVTKSDIARELVGAVEDHVAQFRVPCMATGEEPVTLRQEYVFIPNDGRKVLAVGTEDLADEARRAAMKCMRRALGPTDTPDYPAWALRNNEEGVVLLKMSSAGPDATPEVEIVAASFPSLGRAAATYAAGFRLPCATGPVDWKAVYHYRLEGGQRTILKDASLVTLLRAGRPMPPASFDFNTMGCPFDLRLTYHQPHFPNAVGQLETAVPARQPLLEWLADFTLRVDPKQNTAVLGDSMTVSVPCGKLDL